MAIVLVEERVIMALSMAPPERWETFRPVFVDMVNSLLFFEPEL
jgi:hypothetical protein